MELFHPFAKDFFCNMMFIWSNDSKTCFKNRKWNYLTHFRSYDQKTSLEPVCSFDPRKWNYFTYSIPKQVILTISRSQIKKIFKYLMLIWSKDFKISFGHRKRNYFNSFHLSDEKLLLEHDVYLIQWFQNMFQKQEMELFHTCPFLWSFDFLNRKWNYFTNF